MRILFYISAGACAALMPANIATAKATRLQTVNITDKHMSLEGGEARLYRVDGAQRRHCRIEVVHFGEMGKWIYVFDFGPTLFAAERREYRYNGHIFTTSNITEKVTERTTLASPGGRKTLPKDFEEYKSFFDARRLAACSAK